MKLDVFIGNGIATFATLAIGISIGENILVSRLIIEVPRYTNASSHHAVVNSRALGLADLTTSPDVLYGLRQTFSKAISATMVASCGMKYLTLKVSRKRDCVEWFNSASCGDEPLKEKTRKRQRANEIVPENPQLPPYTLFCNDRLDCWSHT